MLTRSYVLQQDSFFDRLKTLLFTQAVSGNHEPGYPGDQVPVVWQALDALRGKTMLTSEQEQDLINNAVAGNDYPINAVVPPSGFSCNGLAHGYYADTSDPSKCQVFHRCDLDGTMTSYLCPNMTVGTIPHGRGNVPVPYSCVMR